MAYQTNYNQQQVMHLAKYAKKGDEEAFRLLYKDLRRISRAANTRLLRLEKSGWSDVAQAYQRATWFTNKMVGTNRFSTAKSMDIDLMVDQYAEVRAFMSKESSTVKGNKIAQKRLIDALEKYDINIPKKQQREFYKFVNSDTVQDAIDYIGEYDVVMDAIANNINKIGSNFEDLYRQFNEFLDGKDHFDTFLTKLGGVDVRELYKRHSVRNTRRKRG